MRLARTLFISYLSMIAVVIVAAFCIAAMGR